MLFSTPPVLLSLLVLLPAALAQTGTVGTNCNIVRNVTVRAGDSVFDLGVSTNTTVAQIAFVNPQIRNLRSINVGDVIRIPNSRCVALPAPTLAEPTAVCVNRGTGVGGNGTISVVSGDALNVIAKEKLKITLPSLLAVNKQITNPDVINVGQVLTVPICGRTKRHARDLQSEE